MDEQQNRNTPAPESAPAAPRTYPTPPVREKPFFPTGRKELAFLALTVLNALLLVNFTLFGGFRLGFAIGSAGCILLAALYLLVSGRRLTPYAGALLGCSLVIAAAFGYSADPFVKFVMTGFLLLSASLGLCLLAGQNRRDPGGFASLLDAPRTVLVLGLGRVSPALEGLRRSFRKSGRAGQKSGAVLMGLLIAVPVLLVLIPLLISADAAFDGLLSLLPRTDVPQILHTGFWGGLLTILLYAQGTALRHSPRQFPVAPKARKGIAALTINTLLAAVCFVYFVYLISQAAYFIGGFSQILPENYTPAEYARRGFFEMAVVCGINLAVILFCSGMVRGERPPVSTKLLCLFVGLVTLFLVASAGAKMFLYIRSFGLSRLRVLTQAIILWLGLTTALVTLRLFFPKPGYMKAVVLAAMAIGIALIWADVDTQVASYNVNAYLDGRLETVDVSYLQELGDGAVPALARLAEDAPDAALREKAESALSDLAHWREERADFRGYSYISDKADSILEPYRGKEAEDRQSR